MLNEQTYDKLIGLKLYGMAAAFKEQLTQPDMLTLSCLNRQIMTVEL